MVKFYEATERPVGTGDIWSHIRGIYQFTRASEARSTLCKLTSYSGSPPFGKQSQRLCVMPQNRDRLHRCTRLQQENQFETLVQLFRDGDDGGPQDQ